MYTTAPAPAPLTAPTHADVLITEIADPKNEASARYIELFNPCDTPQNLDGYKIVRFVLAITTPEVTLFDLSMMLLGWLLRRGPPQLV